MVVWVGSAALLFMPGTTLVITVGLLSGGSLFGAGLID